MDFSGTRYLRLDVKELKGYETVACVPMNDPGGAGLVYYNNPCTGGDPVSNFPKPIPLQRLSVSVYNDNGRLYNFKGMDSCYVFELVCLFKQLE